MTDGQRQVAYGHAVRTRRGGETAGSRRKYLVAVSACKRGDPSYPASRWGNVGCSRMWGWSSWVGSCNWSHSRCVEDIVTGVERNEGTVDDFLR